MFGIVCSFKGFRAPYLKIRYHVDTMCKVDEFIYFDLRCSIRKHLEIIMVLSFTTDKFEERAHFIYIKYYFRRFLIDWLIIS